MIQRLKRIASKASPDLKKRLIAMAIVLLGASGITWLLILVSSHFYPLLLGLAALSYGFGLRHAVDADHIAAIDNTTRKLMQDGKRPVAVGFFFSLGHATIVIGLCALVVFSASFVQNNLPVLKETGSLIGATVSCLFLLIIGLLNLAALVETISTWRKVVKEKNAFAMKRLSSSSITKASLQKSCVLF